MNTSSMDFFQLFVTLSLIFTARGSSLNVSIAGTQFSALQTQEGVIVSGAVINPAGNTAYQTSNFSGEHLPTECGDELVRCRVAVVNDPQSSSRQATVVPLSNGTGLTIFDRIDSTLILVDQHVLLLADFEPTLDCNITSFIEIGDNTLYGLCYKFDLSTSEFYQVQAWLFDIQVNFNTLNQSTLQLLNQNGPYLLYSTGLSIPFFFDIIPTQFIIWYDDSTIFDLPLDPLDDVLHEFFVADPVDPLCAGDNVIRVKRVFGDQLQVYCSNNTAIEVEVGRRGGGVVPFTRYPTRFYCSSDNNDTYLEQRGESLVLVTPNKPPFAIPHPLNLTKRYVADCIRNGSQFYFVGSSRGGPIVLTNVLQNSTTILAENARVYHQLVQDRFVTFSDTTSSSILDVTCPFPGTPVSVNKQPFHLGTFVPTLSFSCSTVQTAPVSTSILGYVLGPIGAIVFIAMLMLLIILILYLHHRCHENTPVQVAEEGSDSSSSNTEHTFISDLEGSGLSGATPGPQGGTPLELLTIRDQGHQVQSSHSTNRVTNQMPTLKCADEEDDEENRQLTSGPRQHEQVSGQRQPEQASEHKATQLEAIASEQRQPVQAEWKNTTVVLTNPPSQTGYSGMPQVPTTVQSHYREASLPFGSTEVIGYNIDGVNAQLHDPNKLDVTTNPIPSTN